MNSTVLQPIRPEDVQDWVFISENDEEPTVFESDTPPTASSPTSISVNQEQPIDVLFKSAAAVEQPVTDTGGEEEQLYFGDEDIIEDRIPPEKAFEIFLASNYPIDPTNKLDYSGSVYNVFRNSQSSLQLPPQSSPSKYSSSSSRYQLGAESRTERLNRLRFEVDALAKEAGLDSDINTSDTLSQVSDLRSQLNTIEQQFSKVPTSKPFTTLYSSSETDGAHADKQLDQGKDDFPSPEKQSEDVGTDNQKICLSSTKTKTTTTTTTTTMLNAQKEISRMKQSENQVTVQMVSPTVSAVIALEKRITKLEQTVSITNLEHNFDGTSITQILEDVRTRLALATDSSLPERLRDDARQIAQILSANVSPQRMDESIRLGTLLDKVHHWQPVIDAVPILVDRFASVRRLHDEASHFVEAATALSKQMDVLENRSVANRTLLHTVKRTMQENMTTVNENLDILTRKLQSNDQKSTPANET